MRACLGLSHDHLAPEQLDRLVLVEDAEIDQAIVLGPRPLARAWRASPGGGVDRLGLAMAEVRAVEARVNAYPAVDGVMSLSDARPLTSRSRRRRGGG